MFLYFIPFEKLEYYGRKTFYNREMKQVTFQSAIT